MAIRQAVAVRDDEFVDADGFDFDADYMERHHIIPPPPGIGTGYAYGEPEWMVRYGVEL